MDKDLRSLVARVRAESGGSPACERLIGTDDLEELARSLTERQRPLRARETAAFRLGCAGDARAFEPLVLQLNHRDPERRASASRALARLGDPRTPAGPVADAFSASLSQRMRTSATALSQ